MANILVVEDEAPLSILMKYNLEAEDYHVSTVDRGDEAEIILKEQLPDLMILDWMLPGLSGIELCRRARMQEYTRNLPIIMLTARGAETDRIRGLSTGADDYVTKPFSIPELMARVKALLRRSNPDSIANKLISNNICLDRESFRVFIDDAELKLGPTEFRLLESLMKNKGRVMSREKLLNDVWGHDVYIDDRTVDVHIGRLRKLVKNQRGGDDPIRTVRGEGYALRD